MTGRDALNDRRRHRFRRPKKLLRRPRKFRAQLQLRRLDHIQGQRASGAAVLALAFFVDQLNSPGTHDCLRRIKTARLPYRVFTSARQASR